MFGVTKKEHARPLRPGRRMVDHRQADLGLESPASTTTGPTTVSTASREHRIPSAMGTR